jgi:hypothetical protein
MATKASRWTHERGEVETRLEAKIVDLRSDIRELKLRMTNKLGSLIMVATGVLLAAIRDLPAA